jgi:hypothetical protein
MTEALHSADGRVIDTDQRGRATLGHPGRRYLLHEQADGTLVLEPAVVISELERRFMKNSAVQAQIAYAKEHPQERVARHRRRLSD